MATAALTGPENGYPDLPFLSDPWLTLFCEIACDEAMKPGYGPGEASVGVHLELGRDGEAAVVVGQVALCDEAVGGLDPDDAGQRQLLDQAVPAERIAPVPVGRTVRLKARIAAVDGRRCRFEVSGEDAGRVFVRGTHDRVAVDLEWSWKCFTVQPIPRAAARGRVEGRPASILPVRSTRVRVG